MAISKSFIEGSGIRISASRVLSGPSGPKSIPEFSTIGLSLRPLPRLTPVARFLSKALTGAERPGRVCEDLFRRRTHGSFRIGDYRQGAEGTAIARGSC